MLGNYVFIVTGLVAMTFGTLTLAWAARYPERKVPPILLIGPLLTGLVSLAEGVSRVSAG